MDPKTIWLKDEISGRAYFPNPGEEVFDTSSMEEHTYTLLVEGATPTIERYRLILKSLCRHVNTFPICRPPVTVIASPGAAGPSGSSSAQPALATSKTFNACTTKVVKAEKKVGSGGKIEFLTQEAVYVELKPSTANATYVQNYIQSMWGSDYIIVSNDGLQIKDCAATRGE